jgi:hypothetical protein
MTNQTQNSIKYVIYCADYQPLFPSCEVQENLLIQKAEFEELNIVGTYTDKSHKTNSFQSALHLIKQDKAQGILVWDISMIPQTPDINSLILNNKIKDIKSFITN